MSRFLFSTALVLWVGFASPLVASTGQDGDFLDQAIGLRDELEAYTEPEFQDLTPDVRERVLASHRRVVGFVLQVLKADMDPNARQELFAHLAPGVGQNIVALAAPFVDNTPDFPQFREIARRAQGRWNASWQVTKALAVYFAFNMNRDVNRLNPLGWDSSRSFPLYLGKPYVLQDRTRSSLLKKISVLWRRAMETDRGIAREALGSMSRGMLESEPMTGQRQNLTWVIAYRSIGAILAILMPWDWFPTRDYNSDIWSMFIWYGFFEVMTQARIWDSGMSFARIVGHQIRPGLFPALGRIGSRVTRAGAKLCGTAVSSAVSAGRRSRAAPAAG